MIARFRPVTGVALCLGAWVFGALGCVAPDEPKRLNAPPQGAGHAHPKWAQLYVYHNDQGMMADRCISDVHFVPHTPDLSGAGVVRLERYAELLAMTGGTLNYDTALQDAGLLDARVQVAKDFLVEAMPSTQEIDVVVGLAGGRGMTAREAIAGRDVAQQPEPRGRAYHMGGESGD